MSDQYKKEWDGYCKRELIKLVPILDTLGYKLDSEQPHLGGERYLMQAVQTDSGRKLILVGKRVSDNLRVVIKATSDTDGKKELRREELCRKTLAKIAFAYQGFTMPPELLFINKQNYIISIQTFIEQDKTFLDRNTQEQFSIALASFKNQEGAHASTYEHIKTIKKVFGSMNSKKYSESFQKFKKQILQTLPLDTELHDQLNKGEDVLHSNQKVIDQYCGFLTHTDFVPHNFRIQNDTLYLLDHSSLRFGNKYEGWARFLNFMTLYNPELETALLTYVQTNRTPEEFISLYCMRVFRLGEILLFYTNLLSKTSGNTRLLTEARIEFWKATLQAILNHSSVSEEKLQAYKNTRDSLRSDDEKKRQIGLH